MNFRPHNWSGLAAGQVSGSLPDLRSAELYHLPGGFGGGTSLVAEGRLHNCQSAIYTSVPILCA